MNKHEKFQEFTVFNPNDELFVKFYPVRFDKSGTRFILGTDSPTLLNDQKIRDRNYDWKLPKIFHISVFESLNSDDNNDVIGRLWDITGLGVPKCRINKNLFYNIVNEKDKIIKAGDNIYIMYVPVK